MKRVIIVNFVLGGLMGWTLGKYGLTWDTAGYWLIMTIFAAAVINSLVRQ